MMGKRARIRVRRAVQGFFLAGFVAVFFVLADPDSSASQLAYRPRFQWSPAFLLCLVDPLASLAAFAASRALPLLAVVPAGVLGLCFLVPRFFCSHVCPLGTMIDLAGAVRGKRRARSLARFKPIKYGLLGGAILAAVLAIPVAGFIAPLPILARGARAVEALAAGEISVHTFWLGVLGAILLLSFVRRRFWCNYLCPAGALLSLVSRFSFLKRIRTDACVSCGRCAEACSFDAVRPGTFDASADCTYCGQCAVVCEPRAIEFGRGAPVAFDADRRGFIAAACVAGGLLAAGGALLRGEPQARHRPPGSIPEEEFLARCIRCGLCARNCPGPAIRMIDLSGGLAAYATPEIAPRVAGCSPNCNNCGRVCPTGAIQHLPLDAKNKVVMGTARYRKNLCLPHREEENCLLCSEICREAGHDAIELEERTVYLDESPGELAEEYRAVVMIPHVKADRCVGCGLCVMICMEKNVRERGVLPRPAVEVEPRSPQGRIRSPEVFGKEIRGNNP